MKLLPLLLLVTACGSESPVDWINGPTDKPPIVEPQEPELSLKQMLDSFLYDCGTVYKADVSNISKLEYIRYGNPATEDSPNTVGLCTTQTYDGKLAKATIVIKEMSTPTLTKAVLYHELGHCVLGLDHTEQDPQTMMSPMMSTTAFYKANWDVLVKDMCNKYK
jgi:hypothetical protein